MSDFIKPSPYNWPEPPDYIKEGRPKLIDSVLNDIKVALSRLGFAMDNVSITNVDGYYVVNTLISEGELLRIEQDKAEDNRTKRNARRRLRAYEKRMCKSSNKRVGSTKPT